ncbi:MAG: YdaU family protein [Acidithiobacillus sp.]|nr:YdaU family protein [Acidithiobacillus sp.]
MGTEKPKMVWYKFFIADYQRDAAQLSLIEHGAYRLLLDQAYLSGGTLPANPERIFRLLGAINPAEQEAIRSVLAEFFHKGRDGYTHARVTKEVSVYAEKAERNRVVGARGGRPKKLLDDIAEEPRNNPNGFKDETQTATQTVLVTEPKKNPNGLKNDTAENPDGYDTGTQTVPKNTGNNHIITHSQMAASSEITASGNVILDDDDFWLDRVHTAECPFDDSVFQTVIASNESVEEPRNNPNGFEAETQTVFENVQTETQTVLKTEPRNNPSQNTEYRIKEEKIATGVRKRTSVASAPAPTTATWEAYSQAYQGRYGTEPVRNQKVNSQLANLVKRLGQAEAPAVAAFFVNHNGRFYVQGMHQVDLLLRDAEKLRTEWVTRQQPVNRPARGPGGPSSNHPALGRATVGNDTQPASRPTVVRL